VVIGLISSKTPALESPDALRRRVDDAARFIDAERLALSPQCGFASTVAGNPVTEADKRAKLELAVCAARDLELTRIAPPGRMAYVQGRRYTIGRGWSA
jgi:5-methyltetrahydropteroyltriglutamate--homocysteine methyltransferase